jgi:hypothetical protein
MMSFRSVSTLHFLIYSKIKTDPLIEADVIAVPACLPEAGDARLHQKAFLLIGRVLAHLTGKCRTRPHDGHKWLRTSGITAGIPVAAPLHHMDERLMHPEERRKQWRRAMQAD